PRFALASRIGPTPRFALVPSSDPARGSALTSPPGRSAVAGSWKYATGDDHGTDHAADQEQNEQRRSQVARGTRRVARDRQFDTGDRELLRRPVRPPGQDR